MSDIKTVQDLLKRAEEFVSASDCWCETGYVCPRCGWLMDEVEAQEHLTKVEQSAAECLRKRDEIVDEMKRLGLWQLDE